MWLQLTPETNALVAAQQLDHLSLNLEPKTLNEKLRLTVHVAGHCKLTAFPQWLGFVLP